MLQRLTALPKQATRGTRQFTKEVTRVQQTAGNILVFVLLHSLHTHFLHQQSNKQLAT